LSGRILHAVDEIVKKGLRRFYILILFRTRLWNRIVLIRPARPLLQ
jgi:hypothetical protein